MQPWLQIFKHNVLFLELGFHCVFLIICRVGGAYTCQCKWYTNNECLWVEWYKYFHEVKDEMFHLTRQSRVEWYIPCFTEWKYLFHSTNKNIHYLFYVTCTKIQILKQNWFKRKNTEKGFYLDKQNILQAARQTQHGKYYADACVTLNARTAPVRT